MGSKTLADPARTSVGARSVFDTTDVRQLGPDELELYASKVERDVGPDVRMRTPSGDAVLRDVYVDALRTFAVVKRGVAKIQHLFVAPRDPTTVDTRQVAANRRFVTVPSVKAKKRAIGRKKAKLKRVSLRKVIVPPVVPKAERHVATMHASKKKKQKRRQLTYA